jgi:hypothetical protein
MNAQDIIDKTLTSAGLEAGVTFAQTKLRSTPGSSFVVWSESVETFGSDFRPMARRHNIVMDVYEYASDANLESRIEAELNKILPEYKKEERVWLSTEQMYGVSYSFAFVEKL